MKLWIEQILGLVSDWQVPRWAGPLFVVAEVGLILLAAWLLIRLIRRLLERVVGLSRHSAKMPLDPRKADTMLSVLLYIVRVVIWFSTIVTILYHLGLGGTVGSLLATAGIGGIALGLGAQSLVKDYVGGFFLIFDNRLSVGDFVTIGEVTGTVESLTLRTTQIRSWRGELHTIPNGEIRKVTNMSRGAYWAVVDMAVAREADIERACRIVEEEAAAWAAENPDKAAEAPVVPGVISVGVSEVVLRAQVRTTAPANYGIERALRLRIMRRFDEEGIEAPYPRSVVIRRKDTE